MTGKNGMNFDYDLFVIGAGSGGVRAARIAAAHGAKVAVAEEYRIGGTCVIRGCVPKKLMVAAARFGDAFDDAQGFGWRIDERPAFDWPALREKLRAEVARLSGLYRANLERHGVEILDCRAEFAGPHEIRLVGQQRTVRARHILIATGSAPWVPHNIPGAAHAITSNEIFELEELPRSIAIVGGGYIAVEFASILHGLGVETHLLYRGETVLRGFDEELRKKLQDALAARGVRIHTRADVDSVEKHGEADFTVHTRAGETLRVEQVLYATGREPYTFGLGLEKAGVELAPNGAVKVNEHNRTNVEHIFAVGDVTHLNVQLTPVAIREGHAVADRVFGGLDVPPLDYEGIPTAVFTTPELGTAGLTEETARKRFGDDLQVFRSEFRPLANTISGREERTFMKLLVDSTSDRLVGAHLLGEGSGELIQLLGTLISAGATKAQIDATIAVHPTAAEELVTMRMPS